MVGAVVLDRSGDLAGEGYHVAKGKPHAEEVALAAAGSKAEGGTLYVSLEPCTHVHRTPSCAQAVIAAGISTVVISVADPDERVRGRGIAALRASGVETVVGVLEASARRLNEFYFKHRETGRPFVTAKFAVSLDGKIATRTGESRWITGEAARLHGHWLRHENDAILVGVNTVIVDDPELTTRLPIESPRQPLRVVLDSGFRTPRAARVLGAGTVVATTADADAPPGIDLLKLPATARGRVALGPLLDELGRRGILSVLVEGGAEVHSSFFTAGLVDKVYAYIAPMVIGGGDAPGPVGGAGVEHLRDAMRLRDTEVLSLGGDYVIIGYPYVHGNC